MLPADYHNTNSSFFVPSDINIYSTIVNFNSIEFFSGVIKLYFKVDKFDSAQLNGCLAKVNTATNNWECVTTNIDYHDSDSTYVGNTIQSSSIATGPNLFAWVRSDGLFFSKMLIHSF